MADKHLGRERSVQERRKTGSGTVRDSAGKKKKLVDLVSAGASVSEALKIAKVTEASYKYYRRSDPLFVEQLDSLLGRLVDVDELTVDVPDFPEFCEEFLGMRLFPHQLQWFDVLEGREPRGLHPSQVFERGEPDRVIINTPPGHAKSTTVTEAWVFWRIVKDPTLRVVLVSKTQRLAVKFLLNIKTFMTHPRFEEVQKQFGPPGGWDSDSDSWKQDMIYVSSKVRDVSEKDPTIQALGVGGHLYGVRADLVILDDAVDNSNAKDFERQIHWLNSEVASRLPDGGLLCLVGTRMAAQDLYGELRNPARYQHWVLDDDEEEGDEDGVERLEASSPWTYFSSPAVLEFEDKPSDWVTLWPYCDRPSKKGQLPVEVDGELLFEKWSGRILSHIRRSNTPAVWSRVYQQEQVADDTVFDLGVLHSCQLGYTRGGVPDTDDARFGRPGGLTGLRMVAGLDPATVGFTSAVLVGLDVETGVRWVVDVFNRAGVRPDELKRLIYQWQDKYGVSEWRVERNAFQRFLTQDPDVQQYVASRGGVLVEHTTGRNKWDDTFGVASMRGVFDAGLVRLPASNTEQVKALVEQLSYWSPDLPKQAKTDCVMALWFAMLRCNELVRLKTQSASFNTAGDSVYRSGFERGLRRFDRADDGLGVGRGFRNPLYGR